MVYGGRAFWKLAPLSSDVLQAVLRNTGELKWYAEYRYTAISTIWCQGNGASGSPVTVTWFREWALTGSSCSCAQCKNLFFFYPNTINATGGWALLLRLDLSFILFLAQAVSFAAVSPFHSWSSVKLLRHDPYGHGFYINMTVHTVYVSQLQSFTLSNFFFFSLRLSLEAY